MRIKYWLVSPFLLALAGCAGTMTGLDGQGKFSCKAPDGISCASLSGVYANAVQNNLPGQRQITEPAKGAPAASQIAHQVLNSGEPIRSAQKVRRVWLAPWEDDEEVLHDQSYFYMVVDPGHWQVEHSQRKASEAYRPVVPPKAFTPAAPNAGERPALRMERSNPAVPPNAMFPQQGRESPPAGGEGS
jgi:conjugal transfer pilus assembly protein TraV